MITSKHNRHLGAHLSVAGGMHTVFARAKAVGATAVQVFTKSNKAYFAKPLTGEEVEAFKQKRAESGVAVIVAHAAYLINLGASDAAVEKKSIASLREELLRCDQLGIEYLVLHPGSHTGAGMKAGIAKIATNISQVLAATPGKVTLVLETAAGQGTNVGSTFEELRAIYDACDRAIIGRVKFCLDTCHIFAAGYAITTPSEYEQLWHTFDQVVGIEKLAVIHLNDSKLPRGSRRDRHENLGKGAIPFQVLRLFAYDQRLATVPIILETPSEDGLTEYTHELALLRE